METEKKWEWNRNAADWFRYVQLLQLLKFWGVWLYDSPFIISAAFLYLIAQFFCLIIFLLMINLYCLKQFFFHSFLSIRCLFWLRTHLNKVKYFKSVCYKNCINSLSSCFNVFFFFLPFFVVGLFINAGVKKSINLLWDHLS